MKLSEFMEKPLNEAVKELTLVSFNVHTNEAGEVQAVKLSYEPVQSKSNSSQLKPERGR